MANVKVMWTTQDQTIPNASAAHHFLVGVGTMEQSVPLTTREAIFQNVAPGDYDVRVTLSDSNDAALAPMMTASVTVPDVAPPPLATAPVPITVTAVVQ